VQSQRSVRSNSAGIALCAIIGGVDVFNAVANGATWSWVTAAGMLILALFCVQDVRKARGP
jgi:hypothetical protein